MSDRKISVDPGNDGITDYFTGEVLSANDYYAFGATMPGRNFTSSSYRYGYNGKELDTEGMGGGGSTYDYGFRIYNPNLGKFLSTDPLRNKFPYYTPYQYAGNKPIACVDLEGLEDTHFTMYLDKVHATPEAASKWNTDMIPLRPYIAAVAIGVAVVTTGGIAIAVLPEVAAGVTTVGWWAANPANQQLIVGLGGVVASFFDPNPAQDYPGVGDNFVKGFRAVFKYGKQESKFVAEVGSSFANAGEKRIVGKLLGEGKDVTLLTEASKSGAQGIKTADVMVNGILTEIKEISQIKSTTNMVNAIEKTIQNAFKQSSSVIIDVTKQQGANKQVIDEVLNKVLNKTLKGGKDFTVRIIGEGFDTTISKNPVK
ncbi:MAG: hypothetical protein O9353_10775 [Bacteroidia bacterium]|nr:hypothetical protein [Bacteroidia bacterium]